MDGLSPLSSVGWVHFKLSGGWRSTLAVCAVYGVLLGGAAYLTAYDSRRGSFDRRVFEAWAYGMVWLQGLLLVGFGTQRVANAVRRDTTSNMLESHRLMPVTAPQAVIGYILGPAIPVLALALVNSLLAILFTGQADIPFDRTMPSQFLMAGSILFLWPAAVIGAFVARFALGAMVAFGFIYFISQGSLAIIFPGLLVAMGPAVVNLPYISGSSASITAAGLAAVLFQVAFGAIFFAAAARRYSRSDRPAFGMPLGLLLLALCTLASVTGTVYFDDFLIRPRYAFSQSPSTPVPTIVVLLLIALIPVAGAARFAMAPSLRLPRSAQRFSIGMLVLALALAMISFYPFSFFAFPESGATAVYETMAARMTLHILSCAAFLSGLYWLFCLLYRVQSSAVVVPVLSVLWIFATVIGPIMLDGIRHAIFNFENRDAFGMLGCVSPLGTLIRAWSNDPLDASALAGWFFQALVATVPWVCYLVVTRRRRTLRPALLKAKMAS